MNQFTMHLLCTKYYARNYGEGCSESDLASSLNRFWKLRGGKNTQIGITKDDGMRAIESYRVQRSSEKLKKNHSSWFHLANCLLHVYLLVLNNSVKT